MANKQNSTKLATYAVTEKNSRGRVISESSPVDRNEFQRDYSRIIHSNAWRKQQYKTQVFANHEGDLFRTRATHSLEVAQVTKTVARVLGANPDLAETLAIAHDIGHAPFGHTGQDVLEIIMKDAGGFEHNLQALRIVDHLETGYTKFSGLNLMFETREGLLKHCSKENASLLGEVGEKHLNGQKQTLEAQITNWCDSIAYNHADIEDSYNMGVLTLNQLMELDVFKIHFEKTLKDSGLDKEDPAVFMTAVRGMFSGFVKNLISNSKENIKSEQIVTLNDVFNSKINLIAFDEKFEIQHYQIKKFLRANVYSNEIVHREQNKQEEIIHYLFNYYLENPEALGKMTNEPLMRQVCDFVSGMTDRYAMSKFMEIKFGQQMENKSFTNSRKPKN